MTSSGLVSGSWDKSIKIWDLVSQKCNRTIEGHSEEGIKNVQLEYLESIKYLNHIVEYRVTLSLMMS